MYQCIISIIMYYEYNVPTTTSNSSNLFPVDGVVHRNIGTFLYIFSSRFWSVKFFFKNFVRMRVKNCRSFTQLCNLCSVWDLTVITSERKDFYLTLRCTDTGVFFLYMGDSTAIFAINPVFYLTVICINLLINTCIKHFIIVLHPQLPQKKVETRNVAEMLMVSAVFFRFSFSKFSMRWLYSRVSRNVVTMETGAIGWPS